MNTLQNVYDRLSDKTELAKHEVELAQATDVIKIFTIQANDVVKKFDTEYKQALMKVQDIVVRHNDEIGGIANNFDKQVVIYQQKVKELGIDYNSTPFAKIAEAQRKAIVSNAPYFKSILNKVKSL
jgi:hypothetical protein